VISPIVATLLSGAAWGFDLYGTGALSGATVQVNSDLEVRYHQNSDVLEDFEDRPLLLDYWEQVERLNLLLSKPGLTIGAQIDEVALFGNRYILETPDGTQELFHERDLYDDTVLSAWDDAVVVAEKLTFQRRWDHVTLSLGDTYASFGRGIALNIIKNTDIDVDTSIRGARVKAGAGDLEVTAVSGLSNTQLVSRQLPNVGIGDDVPHMVSGVRLEHYGVGPAQVGVHGVVYAFGRAADAELDGRNRYGQSVDVVVDGVSVDLPGVLGIDWSVEGDLFGYRGEEFATEGETGHVLYASANAYPGKSILLVEAKTSENSERLNLLTTPEGWEAGAVPTLEYERVITEDGSAAINSNELSGARVRWDHVVKPGALLPYVQVSAFRDEDTGGLHFNSTPENIGHVVAGIQAIKGHRVIQLNGGYRMDVRDDPAEGADRLAHVDGELHVPVGGHDAIELIVDARSFQWGVNPGQQTDFVELVNALAWHRGEKLVITVFQDYTDNPLINSEGNLSENVYGAVEVLVKPKPSSTFRVFYGAYKAGIRCSGGQCRSLPGFEGGKVSWQTVF